MNKVALIFSSDCELFCDESSDADREQMILIDNIINFFLKYEAKLTVIFEYGQYRAYKKNLKYNSKLLENNIKIEKQLIKLIKLGCDVQLYYHAQWHNTKYDLKKGKFLLDLTNVDTTTLDKIEVINIVREGKLFLEKLLKPYQKDYKCKVFRTASWSIQNKNIFLCTLKKSAFMFYTSILQNSIFKSKQKSNQLYSNNITSKSLKQIINTHLNNNVAKESIIPLIFILDTKSNNCMEELSDFLQYAKGNKNISFCTFHKVQKCLLGNKQSIKVDLIKHYIDESMPVLAKEEYLKCKSDNYGWFKSNLFIIPFYYDKKFIFSRIIFTMDVIPLTSNTNCFDKEEFLNKVIEFISKNKLCDFISKAQSNVIFDHCPKGCTCIPWGTYIINLKQTKEELFNSFNNKSRNIIRKAIKNNVEVKITSDFKLVYNNIKEMFIRQNLINYPSKSYIEKVSKMEDSGKLFIVIKDNVIQGSLVLLYDNYRAYAMYAGSIHSPFPGSLDLLHYEAMKFSINKKISLYDFVGTRINVKKGSKQEGIDRFKRKFNPSLREGFSFIKIIKPYKYFLYLISLNFYLFLNGKTYKDPISEILEEQDTRKLE